MALIDANLAVRAGSAVPDVGAALVQGSQAAQNVFKLRAAREERERAAQVRNVFSTFADDPQGLAQALYKADPAAAMQYERHVLERDEQSAKTGDAQAAQQERGLRLFREVTDDVLSVYRDTLGKKQDPDAALSQAQVRLRTWGPKLSQMLGNDAAERLLSQPMNVEEITGLNAQVGRQISAMEAARGMGAGGARPITPQERAAYGLPTDAPYTMTGKGPELVKTPGSEDRPKGQTDLGKLTADYKAGLLGASAPENERLYQEGLTKVNLGGLDAEKLAQLAEQQGDNYFTASKDFTAVQDAYGRIGASVKNPSAAGDLSLIFNYMKMLDPGSVVRESEFATAAAAGSYGERVQGFVKSIATGERLSDAQRTDFVKRSRGLMDAAAETQKLRRENYSRIAKRAGVDPLDVVDRVVMAAAAPESGGGGGEAGVPEAARDLPRIDDDAGFLRLPSGTRFYDPEGIVRVKP